MDMDGIEKALNNASKVVESLIRKNKDSVDIIGLIQVKEQLRIITEKTGLRIDIPSQTPVN